MDETSHSFQLGTFAMAGRRFPGLLLAGGRVVELSEVATSVRELFDDWGESLERLGEIADGEPECLALEDLAVTAPIEPRQIVQAGGNYRGHLLQISIDEQLAAGVSLEVARSRAPALMELRLEGAEPFFFLGAVGSVCGPYDDVELHDRGELHEWEAELGVIVDAEGQAAAYTVANDISTPDLAMREDHSDLGVDWVGFKNAPTYLPLGPWILPAAFVRDIADLRVQMRLNGETMQDESPSEMVYPVDYLLRRAGEQLRLFPGDLLLTGSPSGTSSEHGRYLRDGDVIEASVAGLGSQRNRCVSRVPASPGRN